MCVVLFVGERMGSLDDVPFKVPLGSLDEPLGMMEPVTAQEIIIPDYHQKLHDLQVSLSVSHSYVHGVKSCSFI